jgi:hypothetical protein
MRVIVEQLVAGETEVLGENLPQRHFVESLAFSAIQWTELKTNSPTALTDWLLTQSALHWTQ